VYFLITAFSGGHSGCSKIQEESIRYHGSNYGRTRKTLKLFAC